MNIDFYSTFLLHTLFELMENSAKGIFFIDTYLPFWPGGKRKADDNTSCSQNLSVDKT